MNLDRCEHPYSAVERLGNIYIYIYLNVVPMSLVTATCFIFTSYCISVVCALIYSYVLFFTRHLYYTVMNSCYTFYILVAAQLKDYFMQ